MTKLIDLTGKRFGRLVALGRAENRGSRTFWLVRCDCGNTSEVWAASLRRGASQSCGCRMDEVRPTIRRTHGMSCTPEFNSWASAKGRCTNPRDRAYPDYGGRGITMAPEWKADFAAFLRDMGPRPPGSSLDRIDNDGPYAPGNCRWATRVQQARNKRRSVFVDHDGQRLPLKEFAALMGVGYTRLHARITTMGQSPAEAVDAMKTGPKGPRGEQNGQSKLCEADIPAIRASAAAGEPHLHIARRYGVTHAVVQRIAKGTAWAWVA